MRITKIFQLAVFSAVLSFGQCALVYNPFTNDWNCGGASGTVGGASNLTTVGAIPYVISSGVLGQNAANLAWDNTNLSLTVTAVNRIPIGRGGGDIANNTRVGVSALGANTTGTNNVAVGVSALSVNNTGINNTAVGFESLRDNSTGTSNTVIGFQSMALNSTGFSNSSVGRESLRSNTTGSANTALGRESLLSNTTGSNNTTNGFRAGVTATSANANTTGSNNVWIGTESGPASSTQRTNSVALGYRAVVNADNAGVLGTAGMQWSVGGQVAPAATLHVENTTASTGVTTSIVRAGAGQSTTSLLSVQNSVGTPYMTVNPVVSDVGTLGSESVSNSDFSTGPFTGWTAGAGWTYSSGAQHTSGTATLTQSFSITANNPYVVVVTITGRTAGSITIELGSGPASVTNAITANTTTALVSTSGGSQTLTITPTTDFDGTITAISVKIVNASNSNADFYDAGGSLFASVRGKASLSNTVFGSGSLRFNTTGIQNTAFGESTLIRNTLGLNNNAFGRLALAANLTGSSNTAIGRSALQENVRGSNNVAIGEAPLYNNISGAANIAIGSNALFANTIGSNNVAIGGTQTLASNISGTNNIAIGTAALSVNTASENTAVGRESLQNNTTGTRNVAVGYRALRSVTTGENNVGFGHLAGALNTGSLTTGSNNTFIGYNTGFSNTTQRSGSVAIGSSATVNADNAGVLGIAGMRWSVGGQVAPAATLHVENTTASTGVTTEFIRAGAGQSTNNLTEWQNSGGTALSYISSSGSFTTPFVQWLNSTEGTCDATTRGQLVMVQGGAGVADTFRVCAKDAADAYAWTALY
jgi:hypothetical protein